MTDNTFKLLQHIYKIRNLFNENDIIIKNNIILKRQIIDNLKKNELDV